MSKFKAFIVGPDLISISNNRYPIAHIKPGKNSTFQISYVYDMTGEEIAPGAYELEDAIAAAKIELEERHKKNYPILNSL